MNEVAVAIRQSIQDEIERQSVKLTAEDVLNAARRCHPWWTGRPGRLVLVGGLAAASGALPLGIASGYQWLLLMALLGSAATALLGARFAWRANESFTQARDQLVERIRTAFLPKRVVGAPNRVHGQGYLYVLRFSTGTIKVGQTVEPARRLREHRRDAAAFGVVVTDIWISAPHCDFLKTETAVVRSCSQVGHRFKNEYFRNITFAAAVAFAEQHVNGSHARMEYTS
jgi:membrane protein implicated in regulation of membrane protease activity